MQLGLIVMMKLYPSLYQELFQNTQTNSDIIES